MIAGVPGHGPYALLFRPPDCMSWRFAARDVDWSLLLRMVRLWRQTNPECELKAMRRR